MLARKLQGAAAAARPQPTFVSSSSNRVASTTNTVTAPTGIQDGDLLVAAIFSDVSGTVTPPAGWSLIYFSASADVVGIAVKTAASESGNYTFTFGSSISNTIGIVVYRNATRVNTLGVTRTNSTIATASSITPTYAGVLCAVFATESSATITSAPALTQRLSSVSVVPSMAIYELSSQTAAATSSYSLTWGGAVNDTLGVQLQITNETSVEPTFIASANTQNASSGATLIINKPTGVVSGDLMFAFMGGNGAVTWTGDTGWTELGDPGVNPSFRVAYKVAGSSEPSSYSFTASLSTLSLTGCIVAYRDAAYDTIAGAYTTGANPLILSSISPSASQSKLIAAGARGAANITLGTPTSMTARVTDNDATGTSYIVCDQTVANGPTGTRAMSTGGTANVTGIMLAIKPTRSLA